MKKILIFVLIAIFSRCDNDEYSSFSEYLENSVYVEKGTNESGGKIYKWENYHTFDFSKYGYKQNGFREVSECYSTPLQDRGRGVRQEAGQILRSPRLVRPAARPALCRVRVCRVRVG